MVAVVFDMLARQTRRRMKPMRYLCLIYQNEQTLAELPPEEMDELVARHRAYDEELAASAWLVAAEALEPAASGTCVRVRNGRLTVADGPHAQTREMVAGFYLLEARDLNEAIQVAANLPAAHLGTVEVRACRDLGVAGTARKAAGHSTRPRAAVETNRQREETA